MVGRVYWSPRVFCQPQLASPQAVPESSSTWPAPAPLSPPSSAKFLPLASFRFPLALPWCYPGFISCRRCVAPCVWSRDRWEVSSMIVSHPPVPRILGYLSLSLIFAPWSLLIFAQSTKFHAQLYRVHQPMWFAAQVWPLPPWCLILIPLILPWSRFLRPPSPLCLCKECCIGCFLILRS